MLKVALCDDDLGHRLILLHIIKKNLDSNGYKYLINEFASGEELLSSEESFDIYFLDIRMEKLTGIETAKKIRVADEKAGIIFVTALKDYVFDAFDVRAFHYILKPVQEDKLEKVLNSLLVQINKNEAYIIAKVLNRSVKILLKEIIYIEAQLRKVIIHTQKETIEYYCKFAAIEQEIVDHSFFKCHRSYIVNLKCVHAYDKRFILLKNNERIYLSKNKYADFSRAFMYYLKSSGN